jgi:hypothetical protein
MRSLDSTTAPMAMTPTASTGTMSRHDRPAKKIT